MPARAATDSRKGAGAAGAGGDVGARLRARREQHGVGLRELARRLGISPSAISQIETGRSRPSVSTLYAIVSELGLSLDELFSGNLPELQREPATPADDAVSRSRTHVQRADSRKSLELETGVRWERLTPQSDSFVDFLHVVYDVGGSSSQGDSFIRHSGREYGLVLSGMLEVTVGFDTYELGPGDSISFDSTVPHCLRNVGGEPVHGVWFVIGRQGDKRALSFDDEPASPSDPGRT
jgi:transcriptional regulator with XRE-family HTH domain